MGWDVMKMFRDAWHEMRCMNGCMHHVTLSYKVITYIHIQLCIHHCMCICHRCQSPRNKALLPPPVHRSACALEGVWYTHDAFRTGTICLAGGAGRWTAHTSAARGPRAQQRAAPFSGKGEPGCSLADVRSRGVIVLIPPTEKQRV